MMLALLHRGQPRARAPRGHGREVHRRRGHGRLRDPGRARGRRAAGRSRRRRDAGGARRAEPGAAARSTAIELGMRTGINTGEVVAGDPTGGHAFVTGDAVVVAQRLEAAASPGEILIGEATHRLVRNAVLVEPLEPMELKGKSAAGPGLAPARRRLRAHPRSRGGSTLRWSAATRSSRTLRDRVRASRPRAVVPPGHASSARRGSASRGSRTSSRRDPRRGDRARRALPPLRRGHHVLAAAGHRPRCGRRADDRRGSRSSSRATPTRSGSPARSRLRSGSEKARRPRRRRCGPSGGCSSTWRASAR